MLENQAKSALMRYPLKEVLAELLEDLLRRYLPLLELIEEQRHLVNLILMRRSIDEAAINSCLDERRLDLPASST